MESLDKTTRSIFVGNIPYEATEEKLMALFSQAGPVIGFRLVYDRESGKPKGYGFCEYNSSAVASSALRNLDNIDYNGRPLRIGPAAGEQNSAEVAMTNNTTMKPPQESPYGEKVEPQQSGAAISQAVASLPPEQLFDLMQQMKQCIGSNPIEARQLLLQNPQLAYALLQAQIIMKIVEPKVAIAMLTRSNEQIPQTVIEQQQQQQQQVPNVQPQMFLGGGGGGPQQQQQYPPNVVVMDHVQHNGIGGGAANMFRQPQQQPMAPPQMHMGHHQHQQAVVMGGQIPPQLAMQQQQQQFNPFGVAAAGGSGPAPGGQVGPAGNFLQQSMFAHQPAVIDQQSVGGGPRGDMKPDMAANSRQQQQQQQEAVAAEMMNYLGRTGEKEKAALIMQVLNLSDEEVAKLPDDQRRSIEVLKNQLKKT